MKTPEIVVTTKSGKPPKGFPSDTTVKTKCAKLVDGASTIAVFEGVHAEQQAEQARQLYVSGSPLKARVLTVADDGMAAVHRKGLEGHPVLL